jgi:hypothetical protein
MLLLARTTRKLPEFCVGVGLFAFSLAQVSRLAFGAFAARLGPEFAFGVYTLMQLGFAVAQLGLCLFTLIAFGADSRWRWALLSGLVFLNLLSRSIMVHAAAPQLLGGGASLAPTAFWDPAAVASFALAFGWMALESLRYHALLRRRMALGLADPVVTNRFFVWGAGTGVTCILVLMLMVLYIQGHTLMTHSLAASLVVTLCGIAYTVVPWLTFVPPAAYVRLVRRRAVRSGFADA